MDIYERYLDVVEHQIKVNEEVSELNAKVNILYKAIVKETLIKVDLLNSLPSSDWSIDAFYWSDGKPNSKNPMTHYTKDVVGFIVVVKVLLEQSPCITFPSWKGQYHPEFECISTAITMASEKEKMFGASIPEYKALRFFLYNPQNKK